MKIYKNLFTVAVLLTIVLMQLASPQAARAAGLIFRVASGGLTTGACDNSDWTNACDLQYALSIAGDGDQIWVKQGTYYPGALRTSTFLLVSGVSIYGGFENGDVSLLDRNFNPATNNTVLSGDIGTVGVITDNVYNVVTINTGGIGAAYVLDGFTITGGYEDSGSALGGGIIIEDASPSLANLIISNNSANSNGGGAFVTSNATLRVDYSSPTFTNVTFSNNSAARGGALYLQNANPTLTSVTFTGNNATGGAGGGINSQVLNLSDEYSIPVLTDVTFSGNIAVGGAGLYVNASNAILNRVTFSGNTASRRGGGLLIEFAAPTLTNVTFSGNTSSNNLADPRGGGGIMNIAGSPILNNVTFNGNTSSANGVDGGAMRNVKDPVGPTTSNPVIRNSIFWGDNSTEITTDGTGTVTISDSVVQGGIAGTNIITTTPILGALANNGGFTQTMAIVAQGSAIDKGGVNSACAATDQRGITRPKGAGCDIGAYERVTSVLASPTGSLTSWTNTFTWTGIDNATWYYLELYTSTDTLIYRKWYTAAETNCLGDTSCSFSPAEAAGLANGSYKWRILDYGDSYGYGGWSAFTNFSLSGNCYTLTTNTVPAGGGTINNATSQNCAGGFVAGTVVQLTAVPNAGYVLDNWSGDAGGSSNPILITIDANKNVAANFRGVTLNVPSGPISSWDHAFGWTGHAAATWYLVQVQTSADAPVFLKWYTASAAGCSGGSACAITPDETLGLVNGSYKWRVLDYGGYGYGNWTGFTSFSLSAACYTLTTNVTGSGTINPSAQNCGGGYTAGTIVQLTAIPNAGFVFTSWSGNASGSSSPTSITMDANKSVTANFRGVTLTTPSGAQGSWNNIFSWTGHDTATWYLLQVWDTSDATVHLQWYTASQTGCAGGSACSISPAATLNLATGSYKWRMLDYGGYGYGNWTNFMNFSVP